MIGLIPLPWKIGAGLALITALVVGHVYRVHSAYKIGYASAISARASKDAAATLQRAQENAALGIQQAATNVKITKAKYEELAPVVQRIYVDRVRVGPAICDGPAAPATSEGAPSGDSSDSPGRLVRADLERDIRALKETVEKDLATGRACQAFVRENGLAP